MAGEAATPSHRWPLYFSVLRIIQSALEAIKSADLIKGVPDGSECTFNVGLLLLYTTAQNSELQLMKGRFCVHKISIVS